MQQAMQMAQGMGGGAGFAPPIGPLGGMDPNAMAQMMGGGMGGFGAPPAGGFGAPAAPGGSSFGAPRPTPPAAAPSAPTPSGAPASGEAKTEDELIAEAIARSMEEK